MNTQRFTREPFRIHADEEVVQHLRVVLHVGQREGEEKVDARVHLLSGGEARRERVLYGKPVVLALSR